MRNYSYQLYFVQNKLYLQQLACSKVTLAVLHKQVVQEEVSVLYKLLTVKLKNVKMISVFVWTVLLAINLRNNF